MDTQEAEEINYCYCYQDAGRDPEVLVPTTSKVVMHEVPWPWPTPSSPATQRGSSEVQSYNRHEYRSTTSQSHILDTNETISDHHPYIQQPPHYDEDNSRGFYQESGSSFLLGSYPVTGGDATSNEFMNSDGDDSWHKTEGNSASPTTTSSSRAQVIDLESEPLSPSISPCRGRNSRPPKRKVVCNIIDCNKKFGRWAELQRHIHSVHRSSFAKPPPLHECHYKGCPRKGEKGFKRLDNLKQHFRGPHREQIPKRPRVKGATSFGLP